MKIAAISNNKINKNYIKARDKYVLETNRNNEYQASIQGQVYFGSTLTQDNQLLQACKLLDENHDEFVSPRFTDRQKLWIRAKLNIQNAKYLETLIKAQDRNDCLLSSLMFVKGGDFQYLNEKLREKYHWNGYDVNPRFSPEEVYLILGSLNKGNEDLLEPLMKIEDKSAITAITNFYQKTSISNADLVEYMQNRRTSKVRLAIPDQARILLKEIAGFSGHGIADILDNVDEHNKNFVLPIATRTDKAGNLKFNSQSVYILMDAISRKLSKINKLDERKRVGSFFLELLDSKRLDAGGIVNIFDSYQIGNETRIKRMLDFKITPTSKDFHAFSQKDKATVDYLLEKGYLAQAKDFIRRKSQASTIFKYSIEEIISMFRQIK